MRGTEFTVDKKLYVVYGEYGDDCWLCREYFSDSSAYFTTLEINQALEQPTNRAAKIAAERAMWDLDASF